MVTSELPSAQAFRVFPPSRPVPISGNFSKSQTKRSLFVTRAEKWKFILPYQSSVQSDPCFEPFQNPLDFFSPLERGNTKEKPIRCTLVFLRKDRKAVSYSNSTLASSFLRSRLHFLILILQHSLRMYHVNTMVFLQRTEDSWRVSSSLPPRGCQGWNSGHQTWEPRSKPPEPACWSLLNYYVFNVIVLGPSELEDAHDFRSVFFW